MTQYFVIRVLSAYKILNRTTAKFSLNINDEKTFDFDSLGGIYTYGQK